MGTLRVGVVGGGIVGLAVAREVLNRRPDAAVTVLEKEDGLARHQTGHNSGVVHAGVYYRPGSLKAELCARGRAMMREFCAEHAVAYEECGKVVVAVRPEELGRLGALEETARTNGVPGLRRLDAVELREIEPHAAGLAALHSPRTAITDFGAVARALAEDIRRAGGSVETGREVTGLHVAGTAVTVATGAGVPGSGVTGEHSYGFDRLIVCGGVQSDRLGRLAGGPADPAIVPFRGEYLRVLGAKRDLVRGLIYPVPDPRYPFLGVHFTRRVDGEVEVGPNAVLALAREEYRRFALDRSDLWQTLRWPGFPLLAARHWRTGAKELAGSLSIRVYLRAAARYVPQIGPADVTRSRVGIRAQALGRDGSLVDDFAVDHDGIVTVVRNAPSPAATSSLAIAEHLLDRVGIA